MSRNPLLVVPLLMISTVLAADTLAEKFQKKLDAADAAYQQAVAKADNARFYAVQKATADRVKVMKQVMTETTKSGDLAAANEIKARIESAEAAGAVRAKPKETVSFGGHEYALIAEKTTWHVAKRICEEMGGHLVCVDSTQEQQGLTALCGTEPVWIGATDEEKEGQWEWVTGGSIDLTVAPILRGKFENEGGIEHAVVSAGGTWNDIACGSRFAFVCEWDK